MTLKKYHGKINLTNNKEVIQMTKTTYESYSKINRVSRKTGKEYSEWVFTGWCSLPNLECYGWKEYTKRGKYLVFTKINGEQERWLVGEEFDDLEYFAKAKRERFQLKELRKYIQNFYALLDDENTPDNVLEATKLLIDEYEALERKWGGEV